MSKIKPTTTRRTVKKVATPAPPATFKLETTDLKLISILQDAINEYHIPTEIIVGNDKVGNLLEKDTKKEGAQSVNHIPNINNEYIGSFLFANPNPFKDVYKAKSLQGAIDKAMEIIDYMPDQKAVEQETDRPTPGPETNVGVIQKLGDIDIAIDLQSDALTALLTTIRLITGKRPQELDEREEPEYINLQSKLAQVESRIDEIVNTIREANYQLKAELEG